VPQPLHESSQPGHFHIGRAATEQICAFYTWLKPIAALRGNNIVVTTEIKSSLARSGRREYTRSFASQIIEAESVQFFEESPGAHSSYWFSGGFSDGIAINRFVEIQHRGLGKPFA
jgi:hypothetical protein